MHSGILLALLSLVSSLSIKVRAQTLQAQCLPGWEWNQNSLGQDACQVATLLDAHCHNLPNYTYQRIGPDEYYLPPRKAHEWDLACDCDSVMYSLNQACSTCQGGSSYEWSEWIKQCNVVLISDYSSDIPQGTVIPHWAFYNVTLLDKQQFDNKNAQSIGKDPEAKPAPTLKGSESEGSHHKGMSKKTVAIICGVVVGVCLLIIASIALYFGLGWRNGRKEERLRAQWDNPGRYGSRWDPELQSPTPTTRGPSFSTGPTLVTNLVFQPFVSPKPSRSKGPMSIE